MERQRIEDRVYIPKSVKSEILKKSKGRCCHCGKKLEVGSTFTLEHIIPLSKGGTYDINNLVALCKKCNEDKGNKIINPITYYKYLGKSYKKDIDEMYSKYLEEFDWLKDNYIFQEDSFTITVPTLIRKGQDLVNDKKLPRKSIFANVDYDVELCTTVKDKEDVHEFILGFLNTTDGISTLNKAKGNIPLLKKIKLAYLKYVRNVDIDEWVKQWIIKGWAYKGTNYKIVKKSSNDIYALVKCDFISSGSDVKDFLNTNDNVMALSFEIMINQNLKNNFKNKSTMLGILTYLMGYLKLNSKDDYFTYPIIISYSKNNDLLSEVVKSLIGTNRSLEVYRYSLYSLKSYMVLGCNDFTIEKLKSSKDSESILEKGLTNYIKYCNENGIGDKYEKVE